MTSAPAARTSKAALPPKSVPKNNTSLPEGWTDITRRSNDPSITLWLAKDDFSATMVLRRIIADDSTVRSLQQEGVCTPAQVLLRLRLERMSGQYRITRMPESVVGKKNFCSYVYEEHGLLRRVVTFWVSDALFEAELLQEHAAADFESLSAELMKFAERYFPR